MRRVPLLLFLVPMACDLNAAFESYRDRFCAEQCVPGRTCPESCATGVPGDDAGTVSTAHGFFKRAGDDTFLVVRLQSSAGPGPAATTLLEERRVADAELVATEVLNERGVVMSLSNRFEGALTRAADGKSLTLGVSPQSASMQLQAATMAHRIVSVRRGELDVSRVLTGFAQQPLFAVATADETTFWAAGANPGVLRQRTSDGGTSTVAQRMGDALWSSLQVVDGRLFAATLENEPRVEDLGDVQAVGTATPVVRFGINRTVTSFAFVDTDLQPGADALFVSERVSLWRFARDGGAWEPRWEVRQDPLQRCIFLAARREGPLLCSSETGLFRFDEVDGGVARRLLFVRTFDGGDDTFRGLAFPAESVTRRLNAA